MQPCKVHNTEYRKINHRLSTEYTIVRCYHSMHYRDANVQFILLMLVFASWLYYETMISNFTTQRKGVSGKLAMTIERELGTYALLRSFSTGAPYCG